MAKADIAPKGDVEFYKCGQIRISKWRQKA